LDHEGLSVLCWHTSSHSDETECVEIAVAGNEVLVRDSWNRSGGHVVFTRIQWRTFVAVLGTETAERFGAGQGTRGGGAG
jgi:hypothetical protein